MDEAQRRENERYNNFLSLVTGRRSAGSQLREQAHWRGMGVLLVLTGLAEATGDAWKKSPSEAVQLLRYMRNAIAHADCDMALLTHDRDRAVQLLAEDFMASNGRGFYTLDDQTRTKFWFFPDLGPVPATPRQQLAYEMQLLSKATWAYATLSPFFSGSLL